MGKIAFVFPGQGAQYVGMGKGFYDNEPEAKEVYEAASKASGIDVEKICFEENTEINETQYTQIAMVATELALFKCLEKKGIRFDYTAGHSLGEYAAIAAAGAMSVEDACALVRKRGLYMQEAVPTGGAMSAVLGLDADTIAAVCEETEGIVSVANYNCPGQIVITGAEEAVKAAGEKLTEKGAKRVLPLKVSGPFHSELMIPAGEKLAAELAKVTFTDPKVPYVANYTAEYVTKGSDIAGLLEKQISGSVQWIKTMEKLIADGVDTFVEIGPGKTLAGFNKRMSRDIKTINIDKYEDFEKALEELKTLA
ncbi:MAG: ACP S-malonyltransferase [Lachnospiraceae bacterium]|nr:ACP S-malonyltransferase [Lachnospiraceae bacterium]